MFVELKNFWSQKINNDVNSCFQCLTYELLKTVFILLGWRQLIMKYTREILWLWEIRKIMS